MKPHSAGTVLRSAREADLPEIERLLTAAGLTMAGVAASVGDFVVAERNGTLSGVVGLELYGSYALLRSAAVVPEWRGTGVGRALVERIVGDAERRGVRELYLLTTTAERWFPRFGFRQTAREVVPECVRASVEFREVCPASAVVMVKRLT